MTVLQLVTCIHTIDVLISGNDNVARNVATSWYSCRADLLFPHLNIVYWSLIIDCWPLTVNHLMIINCCLLIISYLPPICLIIIIIIIILLLLLKKQQWNSGQHPSHHNVSIDDAVQDALETAPFLVTCLGTETAPFLEAVLFTLIVR